MSRLPCRSLLCALIVLVSCWSLAGPVRGEEAVARFELVSSESPTALERQLRSAAERGYRMVAASIGAAVSGKQRVVVLMERVAADSGAWDYAVIETGGDFDAAVKGRSVNGLAADRFRLNPQGILGRPVNDWWTPESEQGEQALLILERTPRAPACSYLSIKVSGAKQFADEMAARYADGFHALGMWNAARSLRVVIERTRGESEAAIDQLAGNEPYHLLIGSTKMALSGQLDRAADRGYRVIDVADQSISAPPMILMKWNRGPGEGTEYDLMYEPGKKIRRDKLERKLNKRGRAGYRVAARAITPSVVVLERPANPEVKTKIEYLALSSRDQPGIAPELENALSRGYRFLALLSYTDETVVVVERSKTP